MFPPKIRASLQDPHTGRPRPKAVLLIVLGLVIVGAGVLSLPRVAVNVYQQHNTRATAARQDMAGIVDGLAAYRLDNGRYPSQEQGLMALIIPPERGPAPANWRVGGYVERLPRDPWGHSYQYRIDEATQSFQVFSYGLEGPDAGDEGDTVILAR